MFVRRVSILAPYNSDKEILLQHRTKDATYLPDYWGFFGGGIDQGETPEDAVKREAMEELGIEIKNPQLFKRYEIEEEKGTYERFIYIFPTSLTAKQLKSQQQEGAGLGFFSFGKTKKLKFNSFNRIILKDIAEFLNKTVK
jgi:8-oxo-dGTP diphosphatase